MTYGLIGEKLDHSYSKIIHDKFGAYDYQLFPLTFADLDAFLRAENFQGLNVTIPYKKTVIPYCRHLSPLAERLGAVNTLYFNEKHELCGTNTDYYGFLQAAALGGLDFSDKKVLILGDGSTAGTIFHAVSDEGAGEILVASRKSDGKKTISYDDLHLHRDVQIIVNTTPVGMYPNNGKSLIDLENFPACCGVFDVIYNPYYTKLLLQAKIKKIPHANGLPMLVAQAAKAAEYFTGKKGFTHKNLQITRELKEDITNIVLIGMPGSGKTSVGLALAKLTGKKFVDMDAQITEKVKTDIPAIFEKYGEEYFRRLEASAAQEVGKKGAHIIATGGGVILNPENMYHLMQNGTVVLLERDLEKLATQGRPLSKGLCALQDMYKKRAPLYRKYSEFTLQCGDDPAENAALILKNLKEKIAL